MHTTHLGKILWSMLLLVCSAMIYRVSSAPVTLPMPGFPAQDKLLHMLTYGVLAGLTWQTARAWTLHHPGRWAWLYATVYGATDEWHQYFVPGRQCDLWDWVADTLGAALVILALRRFQDSNPTPSPPHLGAQQT